MLLYFPHMHPEWLSDDALTALPEPVRFLDPGAGRADSKRHALPPLAPFERSQARALLADTLRFGQSVGSPRDILAQGMVQQASELSPESSRLVLAEVERSMAGVERSMVGVAPEAAQHDDALLAARRQAQMVLLLAWSQEDGLLELRRIGQKLDASWARLDESVGLGEGVADDDTDKESMELGRMLSGITTPVDALPETLPWRKLMECFVLLAPEAVLCTREQGVVADLVEAGVAAAEVDGEGLPAGTRAFRAPAWKLLGLERLPEAKPWLAAELTLAVLAGEGHA